MSRRLLPVHFLKIKYLIFRQRDLGQWEKDFVCNIYGRIRLTEKQISKLEEIYSEIRFGKRMHFVEPVEAWQDIHDFGRS